MTDATLKAVVATVDYALAKAKRATKYVSPALVVKATRRHKPRRNERTAEIVLTIGAPNYAERAFIKTARKAGEAFPIRKVQLKHWSRT